MNECLMIANEVEKARLLACKDHYREERSSDQDLLPLENRKIVAQTTHYTIDEKPQ